MIMIGKPSSLGIVFRLDYMGVNVLKVCMIK